MRTDLDHLPARKQRELERVLQILFEEFEKATKGGTSDRKRGALILKVILFGSYARGTWVEDRKTGYLSDYDLLVVVNDDKLTDSEFWHGAEDRLLQEETVLRRLKTPVGLIVHSLADVNDQIRRGRYFFADIAKEGIALYTLPGHSFVRSEPLSTEAAHKEAQGYFDQWFVSADEFLVYARDGIARGWNNKAAFHLHQAAESFYNCLLLVRTLYVPPSRNLKFLRSLAEGLDPRLLAAWPRDNRNVRHRFNLLKRAYVEARYSKHYKITAEELAWLAECVEHLCVLVETICREHLTLSP